MKVQQKLVSCFFALVTLVALSVDARASCPITEQGPPCQEYWRAEAVFIGTVNRVVYTPDKPTPENWMYVRRTVYITIEEAFRGIEAAALVLNLNSCGFNFKEGERYLIYAHRNPNNKELDVRAGFTRTRLISEGAEDLNYIRGLSPASGSRVFGKVVQSTYDYKDGGYKVESLPNVKVTLAGNSQRLEVVTDSEGKYEFKGVTAGNYRVGAEIPNYLNYDEVPVNLMGRECAPVNIYVRRKGLIVGRVFDVNKKPLALVPVTLVSADASFEDILAERKGKTVGVLTYTDRDGRFRFTELPPGRYFLIINRSESDKSTGSPYRAPSRACFIQGRVI